MTSLKQTPCVCSSDMRHHVIYPDCDVKFTGHVTWVGQTSIEAKMHMSQVHADRPATHRCVGCPFGARALYPTVGNLHRFISLASIGNKI